mmetsp:Transcript_14446/g.36156  ORF Transcript_14446/g.36156 Transcript_14446/m.36156 type:complete len:212 (-) Transcript_14446:731-1366(-)|eukprot:g16811.t1
MAFARHRSQPELTGPEVQQMVYPYSVQKLGGDTVFRRTAAIKNHLRTQARNCDRMSTYDHDFGRRRESIGWDSARSVSARTEAEVAEDILPSGNVPSARKLDPELRNQTAKQNRDDILSGRKSYFQSGGTRTMSQLQKLQEEGRGLNINPAGWAGTHYTPYKFPNEFRGGTDRQLGVLQKIHTLNLRAPDLYFRNNYHSQYPGQLKTKIIL